MVEGRRVKERRVEGKRVEGMIILHIVWMFLKLVREK